MCFVQSFKFSILLLQVLALAVFSAAKDRTKRDITAVPDFTCPPDCPEKKTITFNTYNTWQLEGFVGGSDTSSSQQLWEALFGSNVVLSDVRGRYCMSCREGPVRPMGFGFDIRANAGIQYTVEYDGAEQFSGSNPDNISFVTVQEQNMHAEKITKICINTQLFNPDARFDLKNVYVIACRTTIKCKQPDAPENGSVKLKNGLALGSKAKYKCDDGFTLVGKRKRKCVLKKDGLSARWKGKEPTCEPNP